MKLPDGRKQKVKLFVSTLLTQIQMNPRLLYFLKRGLYEKKITYFLGKLFD
jgi:hypothetical protein